MALCLRHISTKFGLLTPYIITPRSHVIKLHRNASLVSKKADYLEQYAAPPCKHKVPSIEECPGDITEKIHINKYEKSLDLSSQRPLTHHNEGVLLYSNDIKPEDSANKPDPENLSRVYDFLMTNIPKLFTHTSDYTIYHPEIVFENNIRGTTTVGLYKYVKQLALLRTVAHIKFAYVTIEMLKITKHPEDSTVKIRWQIRGISGFRIFLNFWKYKLWDYKNMLQNKPDVWMDGFSTFHVNADGKVFRHVADKMMPDDDRATVSATPMTAAKLAGVVGLAVCAIK